MLLTPSSLPRRGRGYKSLETKRSLSPQGREDEKEGRSEDLLPVTNSFSYHGPRRIRPRARNKIHSKQSNLTNISHRPREMGRSPCHGAMAPGDSGDPSSTCEPLSREIPTCSRERTWSASLDGP